MRWTNYHTHCRFCDGVGEPRDYAEAAEAQGLEALGFSSHAPLPFHTGWNMAAEDWEEYCNLVRSLEKEFAGRLRVHLGLEIDFIPGVAGPRDVAWKLWNLDYTIGSVHFVDVLANGNRWGIDTSLELFEQGLREVFGGNMRRMIERYYDLILQMLQGAPPDILAHFDVIKKFNHGERFFSESAPWYRDLAFDTLEAVAASGVVLEVNTGHLARKRFDAPYPSDWLLERVLALGIPITLNADAHNPSLVAGEFPSVARSLFDLGFREFRVLEAGQWVPREFTPEGLGA